MTQLGINSDTNRLTWPRGSPFLLRMRVSDGGGGYRDLTGQVFRFAAYRGSSVLLFDAKLTGFGDTVEHLFDGSLNVVNRFDGASWQINAMNGIAQNGGDGRGRRWRRDLQHRSADSGIIARSIPG